MTEKFPTLRNCLDREGTTAKQAKTLFRSVLSAAASWPIEDGPAPAELLDDLRVLIAYEDAGNAMRTEAAKHFSRLKNQNEERN